jgi:hypothetical protein
VPGESNENTASRLRCACSLAAEDEVQAALTDGMLEMAGQLRAGAEAMSAALAARDAALASASQARTTARRSCQVHATLATGLSLHGL